MSRGRGFSGVSVFAVLQCVQKKQRRAALQIEGGMDLRYRRKLFRLRDPYDIEASQDLFLQAVRENCAYHYAHCGEYRAILEHFHFSPETLRCETDLARLPALPTAFFKGREIYSVPRGRQLVRATSSGTKGQMSRIGFDAGGLLCGLEMVVRIAQRHSLFSVRPAHYILLGYKPHRGNQTAVTKTAFGATLFTPALSRTYALRYGPQGYEPDLDGVVAAVRRHADSAFPLRFMGFPSYTYFMLQKMEEQGMRLRLHRGSKIMLGGGWKQFYRQQVDKRTLYALAEKYWAWDKRISLSFLGLWSIRSCTAPVPTSISMCLYTAV